MQEWNEDLMKNWFKHWRGWLRGFGSVIDLFGVSYGTTITKEEAWEEDCEAIRSDWQAVGDDLQAAIERHREGRPW